MANNNVQLNAGYCLHSSLRNLEQAKFLTPLHRRMINDLVLNALTKGNLQEKSSSWKDEAERLKNDESEFRDATIKVLGEKGPEFFTTFTKLLKDKPTINATDIQDCLRQAAQGMNLSNQANDFLSVMAKWLVATNDYLKTFCPNSAKIEPSGIKKMKGSRKFHLSFSSITRLFKSKKNKISQLSTASQIQKHQFSILLNESSKKVSQLYSENNIAEACGFSVVSMAETFGPRGQSDSSYLDKLQSIDPGIYFLSFETGSGAHCTQYIKTSTGSYFFDPNKGLYRCDADNPKKTILLLLENYPFPDPDPSSISLNLYTGHFICITKAVPLSDT